MQQAGMRESGVGWRGVCRLVCVLVGLVTGSSGVWAADVDMQLSTREGFVGVPIILDLIINNAERYEPPEVPPLDGLEIESQGEALNSTQISIINGQRRQRVTTTLRYRITPQREGNFEIPPLRFVVDGTQVVTSPLRFSATSSVVDDLLFVEVSGARDRVYVGQPLELTLRILIKPYRDPERGLTISEGDMWNMLAEGTEWGVFTERMQTLRENRQRPGGRSVMRTDAEGLEREYYQYEIKTEIYPKQAGQLDGDGVRIVLNYPTRLVALRSRSPFGEDFFGAPARERLRVADARPLVVDAEVDATQVLPIPEAGRPDGYRGAVGRYSIRAMVSSRTVTEGDPIQLNLAIEGTGPLELVQAPPLDQISELTDNFRVPSGPLAGFVRDGVKYFSTTIRPLRADVTEIPPIPLHYFDPDVEAFGVAFTDAIPVTVEEGELLKLDSIAGDGIEDADVATAEAGMRERDRYVNRADRLALTTATPWRPGGWWWGCMLVPPVMFGVALVGRLMLVAMGGVWRLRSAGRRCAERLRRARTTIDLIEAISDYLVEVFPGRDEAAARIKPEDTLDREARMRQRFDTGIGGLRLAGAYTEAAQLERWFAAVWRGDAKHDGEDLSRVRREAEQQLELISAISRERVVGAGDGVVARPQSRWFNARTGVGVILVAGWMWGSGGTVADAAMMQETPVGVTEFDELAPQNGPTGETDSVGTDSELGEVVYTEVLTEAQRLYDAARSRVEQAASDQGSMVMDDDEDLSAAIEKYRWLLARGLSNASLYVNLANAESLAGEWARAAAHYQWALSLDPNDPHAWGNWKEAEAKLAAAANEESASPTSGGVWEAMRNWLRDAWYVLGTRFWMGTAAVASLVFWGLWVFRLSGWRFAAARWSVLPGAVWIFACAVCLSGMGWGAGEAAGLVVTEEATLRAGAGADFEAVGGSELRAGTRVMLMETREDWVRVQTAAAKEGWLPRAGLETLPAGA